MRVYYKERENKTLRYVEVMSLYPYIYKYFKYPVGHSVIHLGGVCKYKVACILMDGLIKCSIVPPARLHHPVHPYRCYNKLMICLCRT